MLLTKALTLFLSISKCTLTAAEQGNSSSEQDDQSGSVSVERHNAEIISQLAEKPVQGVRKMTDDEGEKFFLDYWRFVDNAQGISLSGREAGDHNATMGDAESDAAQNQNKFDEELPAVFLARTYPFRPSFLSSGSDANLEGSWESSNSNSNSNSLQPRNFKCPTGTYGCTSINRPNRCCRAGETCELVSDTGSGDVGCCPSGETCSGIVGYCQAGYTACSDTLGGGCCIPGYDCVPGGCAYIAIVTVTVHSTVTTSTKTESTVPQESPSSSSSSTTKSSGNLVPPARPTSLTTATTVTSSLNSGSICPTGFYACSAVYHGGCCRTGRNCDTTSCPTTSSTTLTSDGRTIVVPVATSGSVAGNGQCANGWFSCADTVGGGCCPTGFVCGASCTAMPTASAATTVAKEQATSEGSCVSWRDTVVVLGMALLATLWGV